MFQNEILPQITINSGGQFLDIPKTITDNVMFHSITLVTKEF